LHYVFELPSGADFPPMTRRHTDDDASRLRRYVDSARELAESSVMTERGHGYQARFTPQDVAEVRKSLPRAELVRGMAALFRQLYANEERASFASVSGLLRRDAEDVRDAHAQARRNMLDAWRTAHGKLRGAWLDNLVKARGQELGRIPPAVGPLYGDLTPERMLSAYFYGDHLHWDRGAEDVARWKADPFDDAHHGLLFLRAMGQLSALYIGFAALVITASPMVDFDLLI
jgi:hypothetical protein